VKLEPRPSSHLYLIANESYEWRCGTDKRGYQVFLYAGIEDAVAIVFDSEGNAVDVIKEPLIPYHPAGGPGSVEAQEARDMAAIEALENELGFAGGTIRIRRQAIADLIIEDWPSYFDDFLQNPSEFEPREENQQRVMESIRRWQREGCYVLWFGKDYWMEGDGTIEST
jgi:hypothetical protein